LRHNLSTLPIGASVALRTQMRQTPFMLMLLKIIHFALTTALLTALGYVLNWLYFTPAWPITAAFPFAVIFIAYRWFSTPEEQKQLIDDLKLWIPKFLRR
jgi:hypothetical protein